MTYAVSIAQQGSNNTTFRNRIINGAMMIDQRNNGASVTAGNGVYTLDRWQPQLTQSSKFSVQQNAGSVTPPTGFSNYLGVTSLSGYSVVSSDYFLIGHAIEANNTSDFAWGTANAKTVTLSFQVYSSLTGTFGGSIKSYGYNYSYPFSYTISSANTWTPVSITIAGPTAGTWNSSGNNGSLYISFSLGAGSTYSGTAGSWSANTYFSATGATSVVGTNGATFYITGVQLESGSTASPFENRSYGTELALCQRYFIKGVEASAEGDMSGANALSGRAYFPVAMRIAPASTTPTLIFSSNMSGTTGNSFSITTLSETAYQNAAAAGHAYAYWTFDVSAEL